MATPQTVTQSANVYTSGAQIFVTGEKLLEHVTSLNIYPASIKVDNIVPISTDKVKTDVIRHTFQEKLSTLGKANLPCAGDIITKGGEKISGYIHEYDGSKIVISLPTDPNQMRIINKPASISFSGLSMNRIVVSSQTQGTVRYGYFTNSIYWEPVYNATVDNSTGKLSKLTLFGNLYFNGHYDAPIFQKCIFIAQSISPPGSSYLQKYAAKSEAYSAALVSPTSSSTEGVDMESDELTRYPYENVQPKRTYTKLVLNDFADISLPKEYFYSIDRNTMKYGYQLKAEAVMPKGTILFFNTAGEYLGKDYIGGPIGEDITMFVGPTKDLFGKNTLQSHVERRKDKEDTTYEVEITDITCEFTKHIDQRVEVRILLDYNGRTIEDGSNPMPTVVHNTYLEYRVEFGADIKDGQIQIKLILFNKYIHSQ